MVDAVLLILREMLEAALMLSLLLALSYKYNLSTRWGLLALIMGAIGSWLLAHYAFEISDAIDGTGQELLNTFLYGVVTLSFIFLAFLLMPLLWQGGALQKKLILYILFIIIISFSLMREVSEIWIYLSSFEGRASAQSSVLIGAVIGAGIALSLGTIAYYFLILMQDKFILPVFLLIFTLLAGGLSMQIAKQLLQIGVLESAGALWNSSSIVNEKSWLGELLYALLGYDAQPTSVQIIFYASAIAPILVSRIWFGWRFRGMKYE